jgi:hypothetical protein
MEDLLAVVSDGKPLSERTLQEIPPFGEVFAALAARPPKGTRVISFTDPGPPAAQGRVEVPVRPEGGR